MIFIDHVLLRTDNPQLTLGLKAKTNPLKKFYYPIPLMPSHFTTTCTFTSLASAQLALSSPFISDVHYPKTHVSPFSLKHLRSKLPRLAAGNYVHPARTEYMTEPHRYMSSVEEFARRKMDSSGRSSGTVWRGLRLSINLQRQENPMITRKRRRVEGELRWRSWFSPLMGESDLRSGSTNWREGCRLPNLLSGNLIRQLLRITIHGAKHPILDPHPPQTTMLIHHQSSPFSSSPRHLSSCPLSSPSDTDLPMLPR